MMYLKFRLLPVIFLTFWSFCSAFSQDIAQKLESLSATYKFSFEKLKTDTFFEDKYLLVFNQKVDHRDSSSATFSQRVFLSHKGFDDPVVFITEGYGADYASQPAYVNELSPILGANQICVEHRYFGKSRPENSGWEHLTVYNAATDHHHVVEALKNLYPGKWVNTGISKGGQTTMYHRYFYPDDVDASVGYVCPLNFSIEDKRVYRFLENVGDSSERAKIRNFQIEMLKNKSSYLPEFIKIAKKKGYTYQIGIDTAYELTVLEYSFAFWQWYNIPASEIPVAGTPQEMVHHLDQVAGLNWISDSGIESFRPFFYQALTEIGFYGYAIEDFKPWVSFKKNPTFTFTFPDSPDLVYDPEPMQQVDHFVRHRASNMMFIYGEVDPWSSTAVDLTYSNNLVKIVKPRGSHTTRISNLPEDLREEAVQTLKKWLNIRN